MTDTDPPSPGAADFPRTVEPPPAGFKFKQRERLTRRLRYLARSYTKGLPLIKEFLQNADDAGATDLRIVYDRRTHTGAFPDHPGMEVALGPALLFYNDRGFTAHDFEGIQRIGEGSKADNAGGTGRFGQGFNTCYNVTDHPSILTTICQDGQKQSTRIGWFDPHEWIAFEDGYNAWNLEDAQRRWPDWVKTFAPAFPKHVLSDPKAQYTVFRLPLRTSQDALRSEIKKEAFLDEDFDRILRDIQHIGPALLVFLRSIHSLEIREIDQHTIGDDYAFRYWMASLDAPEITDNRTSLCNAVQGAPQELLARWQTSSAPLPLMTFDQTFLIKDIDGTDWEETWAVTTGLFRGPDNKLLDAALTLCTHQEKAIPWVGAAVCKSLTTTTTRHGGLSCFLPLPETTRWPVWLHGWFDIDSNRMGITRTEDVGPENQARYDWNLALMEHAVGPAWALLMQQTQGTAKDHLKPYDLWPRAEYTRDELDEALLTGFYRTAAELPVIRGCDANGYRWCGLNDEGVYGLPRDWHDRLLAPLLAEGWTLIDPLLSSWAKSGFEKIRAYRSVLTPENLRQALRMDHDIACTLENAPRPALRRHDWISALGEFCAEGEWNRLYRLPFALLADGLLHTFTECGKVYWAVDNQRALLELIPNRLLNIDDYQTRLRFANPNTANVYKLELGGLIECIQEILEQAQGKPNLKWLSAVFNYLATCPSDVIDYHAKSLKELRIIPHQLNEKLHMMGFTMTPLIPGDVDKSLRYALNRIKVSLLDGPKELIDAITHFARQHAGKFIWPLTPQDLADPLTEIDETDTAIGKALDEPRVLHPLIDFLASKTWLYPNNPLWSSIRQLRILPTLCNRRVSAEMKDVYIPTDDFTPPEGVISDQYRLLYTGPQGRWRRFYDDTLKIDRLDGNIFIQDIFLPFLTQPLPQERRTDYLKWLRDNLRSIESKIKDSGQRQNLRKKLRETSILPLKDGSLAAPCRVYHPKEEVRKELESLLGEDVFRSPDMRCFKHQRDLWRDFFTELGLPTEPLADDLLAAIQKRMATAQQASSVKTVREPIKKLVEYLRKNWATLTSLSSALADLAWLPALPHSESAAKYAAACKVPDRLWKASELIPPGRPAHLAASQYPILDGPELPSDMAAALRMHTLSNITLDEVLKHFAEVRNSSHPPEATRQTAIECYRFFGEAAYQTQRLSHLSQQPCVYIAGQWHRPDRCFFETLPFTTRWAISLHDAHLDQTTPLVRNGLSSIGVRSAPTHHDWSVMLNERKSEYGQNPLNSADLKEVRHALHEILKKAPAEWYKSQSNLPLPLFNCQLERAGSTFIPDDPRLERMPPLNFLPLLENNEDAQKIGRDAGARSLSAALKDRLKEVQLIEDDPKNRAAYIKEVQEKIITDEFYECLRRLAYHEALKRKQADADSVQATYANSLEQIRSLRLQPAKVIIVESFVILNQEELIVFEQKANSFFDDQDFLVWLSSQGANRRIGDDLIEVICQLTRLTGQLQLRRLLDVSHQDMLASFNDDDIAQLPQTERFIPDDSPAEPPPVSSTGPTATRPESPNTPPHDTPFKRPESADAPAGGSRGDTTGPFSSKTKPEHPDPGSRKEPHAEPTPRTGRVVTYLYPEPQTDYDTDEDSAFDTKEVGDRGEDLVQKDEEAQGRTARRMGTNHEGYDLESTFQGATRYIEVKTTRGPWGNSGVPVSYPQYEAALQYGEAWWLYVVEYVDNADHSPVIHRIPNPFNRVTEFRFDGGWRSLATDQVIEPSLADFIPGVKVDCGPFGCGTIIELKNINDMMVIIVDFEIGGSRPIPFKPEMIKIIG